MFLSTSSTMEFLAIMFMAFLCNMAHADPIGGGIIPPDSKESSPNPIATIYPNSVTGTLNGTLAVVPIPLHLARSIIPAKYAILEHSYRCLLPNFPPGKYPLIVRTILDHDIVFQGKSGLIPDFQSVHLGFPFVDLLGDGYSTFAYEKYLIVTATNLIAQSGAATYGEIPVPALFDPTSEAYAFTPDSADKKPGTVFLNAYTDLLSPKPKPSITTEFTSLPPGIVGPYPMKFYINATNQPIFSNGVVCDQQITFYNTTLSTGKNTPVQVKGQIAVGAPYLPDAEIFHEVYGIKVDTAFIENNALQCSSLKGYTGPGPL